MDELDDVSVIGVLGNGFYMEEVDELDEEEDVFVFGFVKFVMIIYKISVNFCIVFVDFFGLYDKCLLYMFILFI